MRNKLVKKFEPLRRQLTGKNSYPCGISTRSVETGDETKQYRIITGQENDRKRIGCCLGRDYRRTIREDDAYPSAY